MPIMLVTGTQQSNCLVSLHQCYISATSVLHQCYINVISVFVKEGDTDGPEIDGVGISKPKNSMLDF